MKVVLLGKEFCGKTSLVERFLNERFIGENRYQNTIGAAYGAKKMEGTKRNGKRPEEIMVSSSGPRFNSRLTLVLRMVLRLRLGLRWDFKSKKAPPPQ